MKNKLLIINKAQFGYTTRYYKFCEYLRKDFSVTYIGFDQGYKKLVIDGINAHYVSNSGSRLIRGIRFFFSVFLLVYGYRGRCLISYFPGCHYIKFIYPRKMMILDIRSLSIDVSEKDRKNKDARLKKTAKYFDHITILSDSLREKLGLLPKNSSIVPLGADIISTSHKHFNDIKILYVGSLDRKRKISDTIFGLNLFLKSNKHNKNVYYDIIGDGTDRSYIEKTISKFNLSKKVKLHGTIAPFNLKPFFDNANIGVSYVPITDYYNFQPVTKTYEYILSGIPCIATKTYENKGVINEKNGVLCGDTPEGFALALEKIISQTHQYHSKTIRETLKEHTWKNIVKNKLTPILQKDDMHPG